MFRIAFDPALPVVAAAAFTAGDRRFAAGDLVNWRSIGVTVEMLHDWWLAALVFHPVDAEATPVSSEPEPPPDETHAPRKRRKR